MTRPDRTIRWIKPLLLSLLFCALPALAHPGHGPHGPDEIDEFARTALLPGFLHPWSGLGHWMVSLGAGLLATRSDIPVSRRVPAACLILLLATLLHAPGLFGGIGLASAQAAMALTTALLTRHAWPRLRSGPAYALALTGVVLAFIPS